MRRWSNLLQTLRTKGFQSSKKKADKKYLATDKGKEKRRDLAKKHRSKLTEQEENSDCVHDHGAPVADVELLTAEPAIVVEQKIEGDIEDAVSNTDIDREEIRSQRSERLLAVVRCCFCGEECSGFQRFESGTKWKKQKQKYAKHFERSDKRLFRTVAGGFP